MKKLVMIGVVMLMVVMGVVMLGGCNRNERRQEFCYETVIVSLTVSASALDRTWVPADFSEEVSLSEVSVLMTPISPGNRMMLLLTLENPGRENVLRAAYALANRDDVYRVDLNAFYADTIK